MQINLHEYNLNQQQEDNILINNILNKYYFSKFKKGKLSLELIISNNKYHINCVSNSDNLYEISTNRLNNITQILNFYNTEKFKCDLIIDGIDPTNKYILYEIQKILKNNEYIPNIINIPININDLLNIEFLNLISLYKDINIQLQFIPIIYENFNTETIALIEKFDYIIWYLSKNNLDDSMIFYNLIINQNNNIINKIKFKEILDSSWDKIYIENLLKFYMIHIKFLELIYSKEDIINSIFNNSEINFPIKLLDRGIFCNKDYISCECQKRLSINLINEYPEICFCPELKSKFFISCKYINNEFIADKADKEIIKHNLRKLNLPVCEECIYNNVCYGYCLANSINYEYFSLVPQPEVCLLQKSKINLIIQYIKDFILKYKETNKFYAYLYIIYKEINHSEN